MTEITGLRSCSGISPEDFIDPFYHDVAVRFWEQMESGKGNPAQIMDSYSDEEEHKESG